MADLLARATKRMAADAAAHAARKDRARKAIAVAVKHKTGLSRAARNARAAHSSAGTKTPKPKTVTAPVTVKAKGGLGAWLSRKLGVGTRTAAIKRQVPEIKTDAERRAARKAK